MLAIAVETTWIEATDDSDIADAVMIARNRGDIHNDEMKATTEAMHAHARECKARYRNAYKIEMVLGQASAMGTKWGNK